MIRTQNMHKVALLNGELVEADSVHIPAVSAASLYGHGVFTTVAVYDGEPFLLKKHLERLTSNAQSLGIDVDFTLDQLAEWVRLLLNDNQAADCRARITLFDVGGAGLWRGRSEKRTDVLIVIGERAERPDSFRLAISPNAVNSTSPLAGIKSCNYLEHLIAYEDAKRGGFDEAIRLNERGEVTSAAMSNIFWLRDGQLLTPSLETGCLAGTTREFILDNLDVREVCVGLDEMLTAGSIFACSSGIGIKQVQSINDKQFDLIDHAILHLLPPNTKTRMSAR